MDNMEDRRIQKCFKSLNDRQEIEMTTELIDFIIWYKSNKDMVDDYIRSHGNEVNNVTLVDFWIDKIGKSKTIENYLKDINVVADTYEYVKAYKDMFLMLKDTIQKNVFFKTHYRTHEQAEQLKHIFIKYKNHPMVVEIIAYLERNGFDVDHLPKDYAIRILNKCSKLK